MTTEEATKYAKDFVRRVVFEHFDWTEKHDVIFAPYVTELSEALRASTKLEICECGFNYARYPSRCPICDEERPTAGGTPT